MLDGEGVMSATAGLVRHELLCNLSEIPNWTDEWKTRRKKRLINQPQQSVAETLSQSQSFKGRKEGITDMLQIRQRFAKDRNQDAM